MRVATVTVTTPPHCLPCARRLYQSPARKPKLAMPNLTPAVFYVDHLQRHVCRPCYAALGRPKVLARFVVEPPTPVPAERRHHRLCGLCAERLRTFGRVAVSLCKPCGSLCCDHHVRYTRPSAVCRPCAKEGAR